MAGRFLLMFPPQLHSSHGTLVYQYIIIYSIYNGGSRSQFYNDIDKLVRGSKLQRELTLTSSLSVWPHTTTTLHRQKLYTAMRIKAY